MSKTLTEAANEFEARLFKSPTLRDVLQYPEWLEMRKAIVAYTTGDASEWKP